MRGLEARGHSCSLWLDDLTGRNAIHADDAALERGDAASSATSRRRSGAASTPGAAPRSRSRRAGRPPTAPSCWAAAASAPTSCRTTSRSSTRPAPSPSGRPRPTAPASTASPPAKWLSAAAARPLRGERQPLRPRHRPQPLRPRAGLPERALRVLFYARRAPRAAPSRSACSRSPSCTAAASASRSACSARRRRCRRRSSVRQLGLLSPAELATAYHEAAAGMALSLTNPSLVPQEMPACGLPCVDVERPEHCAASGAERGGRAGRLRLPARSPTRSSGRSTTASCGSGAAPPVARGRRPHLAAGRSAGHRRPARGASTRAGGDRGAACGVSLAARSSSRSACRTADDDRDRSRRRRPAPAAPTASSRDERRPEDLDAVGDRAEPVADVAGSPRRSRSGLAGCLTLPTFVAERLGARSAVPYSATWRRLSLAMQMLTSVARAAASAGLLSSSLPP